MKDGKVEDITLSHGSLRSPWSVWRLQQIFTAIYALHVESTAIWQAVVESVRTPYAYLWSTPCGVHRLQAHTMDSRSTPRTPHGVHGVLTHSTELEIIALEGN